ncbi:hypothetical protein ACFPRL_31465 [Pseudoclavibacter helvolus]
MLSRRARSSISTRAGRRPSSPRSCSIAFPRARMGHRRSMTDSSAASVTRSSRQAWRR